MSEITEVTGNLTQGHGLFHRMKPISGRITCVPWVIRLALKNSRAMFRRNSRVDPLHCRTLGRIALAASGSFTNAEN